MDKKPLVRIHSQECYDEQQRLMARAYEIGLARGAFQQQWPHACEHCYASGNVEGDRSVGMDYDMCPSCLEHGRCPRCAAEFPLDTDGDMLDDGERCPACGWVYNETEPMPPSFADCYPDYDCLCLQTKYEEDMRDYYEQQRRDYEAGRGEDEE